MSSSTRRTVVRHLVAATLALLSLGGTYVLLARFSAELVAGLLGGLSGPRLAGLLAWGLLLASGAAFLAFARDLSLSRAALEVSGSLRERVAEAAVKRPLRELVQKRPGEMLSSISHDVGAVEDALLRGAAVFVPNALLASGLFAAMLVLSWQLSLLLLLVAPPLGLALGRLSRLGGEATTRRSEKHADLMTLLSEVLRGAREIRSLGLEGETGRRLGGAVAEVRAASLAEERAALLHPLAVTLCSSAAVAVAIAFAVSLRQSGAVSREALVGFLTCLGLSSQHLQDTARALPHAARLLTSLARLEPALLAPEPDTRPDLPDGAAPELRLENVRFSYEGSPTVLDGVSLSVLPGEIVALMGSSGAGKSTLLDVAGGLLTPSEGTVRLGGHDLSRFSAPSVQAAIGLVSQEPLLFEGTILSNLRLGRPEASEAEVAEAVRAAHAGSFLSARPGGLASGLGPGGSGLSVGERQRVSLARALLRRPKVLLLDEPTSALDPESERALHEALRGLSPRPSILVVSHRPGVLAFADRVVHLDRGRVRTAETS